MIDPESQCHLVFIFTLFSFRIQQFFHRSQRPASQPQLFVFELHHGNSNNSKKYGERCKYRHWQSNKKALSLTQTLSLSLPHSNSLYLSVSLLCSLPVPPFVCLILFLSFSIPTQISIFPNHYLFVSCNLRLSLNDPQSNPSTHIRTLITASFLLRDTLAASYFSLTLQSRSLSLATSNKSLSRQRIFSFIPARRKVPRARSTSDIFNLQIK